MATRLAPLDHGWHAWIDDAAPPGVSVRVRVDQGDDGRLHIVQLDVEGRLSADVLRAIPVGRIEATANAQLHPSTPGHAAGRAPRRRATAIPARLRANAVRGYPDAFYDAVASTYRHLAATSPRPVGLLAAANDVPLTTAQRWVKEARRRGLLAPGRPGKSG